MMQITFAISLINPILWGICLTLFLAAMFSENLDFDKASQRFGSVLVYCVILSIIMLGFDVIKTLDIAFH